MSRLPIPNDAAKMVDASGKSTPVYRQLFQRFADAIQSQIDDLATVLASITELTADVAGTISALALKADKTTEVRAIGSLDGGGTLDEALITFALDGDEDAPGAESFYGTNGAGTKGWHALTSSGVGADLATHIADTGNPHSVTAAQVGINDTDDIAEGANLYFTDERAQDALAAAFAAGSHAGITITYTDASNKFDFVVTGGSANIARTTSATTGSATGAGSLIPTDNTKPQNTEGAAFASLDTTITVANASSTLRVTVYVPMLSGSTLMMAIIALFRDSGADAIAAQGVHITATGGYVYGITMVREFAAGSTGATTFKIRYGHNTTSAQTVYINRTAATADYWNGTLAAFMLVEEIPP